MDTNPGPQPEVRDRLVIPEREAGSIGRFIEQEKEAVGAIDFAAAMLGEKCAD